MLPEREMLFIYQIFLKICFVTESGHCCKKCLSCQREKKVKQSLLNSGHFPSFLRLLDPGGPIIMEDPHTHTPKTL